MNSIKVEYEVEQNKILDDMFKGSAFKIPLLHFYRNSDGAKLFSDLWNKNLWDRQKASFGSFLENDLKEVVAVFQEKIRKTEKCLSRCCFAQENAVFASAQLESALQVNYWEIFARDYLNGR